MKSKFLIIFATIMCFTTTVKALEKNEYYTNQNGVVMNEVEYENILKLHGKDYLEVISKEIFDKYKCYYSNENLEIEKNESFIENNIVPYSSSHETNYKKISISSAKLNNNKMIVTILKWKAMPSVRSYDVLGVRLYNTAFKSSINTSAIIDGKSYTISGSKIFDNGYGASIKLPNNCSSITIQQMFEVSTGGTVYASYQHATKNISLSNSLDFTISSSGLGGVFNFANNDLFDKMAGVNISI